ncbi:MAG: NAD(P)H-dependent glycerol-3-phosphate dehydrogenase [Acidimicrobiia bacterium]
MDKVAVIGAGSWGTTVAWLAGGSVRTHLWARRDDLAASINETRTNRQYLGDVALPDLVLATDDLAEAVDGAGVVVMAVPSHGFRDVFTQISGSLSDMTPVCSLTKGIEQGSLALMTQVIGEVSRRADMGNVGVLTGPNLASEIAAGQPTAAVVAMPDQVTAEDLQQVFMSATFRVYTNDDVVGCELGGALKNVMAIAAGMSDGLGFGDNTRAALLTRALAELTRLGVALGGRSETFAGLAGIGDLIATCISSASRNHRVGVGLAEGKPLEQVIDDMKMVAEGVKTTKAVLDLSAKTGIEMPIAEHVGRVLYEGLHPREAVVALMTREAKPEQT